jgi:hypothetical protein
METSRPKAITLASGDQRLDPERIMGTTPTAAAIVVRKIGRKRRSPASIAACTNGVPAFGALVDGINQDDGVAHHESAQADNADKGCEAKGVSRDKQSEVPRLEEPTERLPSQ